MKHMKTLSCLLALICLFGATIIAQEKKDKRSSFERTVDLLIAQVDKQTQDRNALFKKLKTLSATLKANQSATLDRRIFVARNSAVLREALLTGEKLIAQNETLAIKTDLIEYLRRVVVHDQELYSQYLEQKAAIQFQIDRQISKIRAEQSLLASIRRDLEKLKFFPAKKERFKFFLETASHLLDGLSKPE